MPTAREQRRPIDRLILVFAAESGAFHAFLDSAKKVLRIKGCTLCSITHGLVGEKAEWKTCREELGVPVDSVHLDEIDSELAQVIDGQVPCIVAQTGDDKVLLLGPDVLERCRGSVADLKGRLFTHAAGKGLSLAIV